MNVHTKSNCLYLFGQVLAVSGQKTFVISYRYADQSGRIITVPRQLIAKQGIYMGLLHVCV